MVGCTTCDTLCDMKILLRNIGYLLLAAGIVLIWRGVWGLADMYLFPNNLILSYIISIIVGILILLFSNFKQKDIREIVG